MRSNRLVDAAACVKDGAEMDSIDKDSSKWVTAKVVVGCRPPVVLHVYATHMHEREKESWEW